MNEYYFDTYAIIELLKGNLKYEFVKEKTVVTSAMNLAEVYYSLLLENGRETADTILDKLNCEYINITIESAKKSALFRHKHKKAKMSYIDCLGYTLAQENTLLFLTGDKEFEKLENVAFVK